MLTLLHSATFPIGRYADVLTREAIVTRSITDADQLVLSDPATLQVALVDPAILEGTRSAIRLDSGVVIGGTSLFGGRGTVIGTLIGAVIVGVFRNGLTLIGVEVIYQYLVTGILVILAVAVDQLTHRRRL